jgi:serine/threonine protein kinase
MAAGPDALSLADIQSAFPSYTICGPISGGGQGNVYRAAAADGAEWALKVYSLAGAVTRSERVEWEIDALAALTCPTIVRLASGGRVRVGEYDCMWTLTEFVHGSDVDALLQNGALGDGRTRRLVACVAQAIDAL